MKGQPFFFDENIFDEDDPRQGVAEEEVQKPEFTKDELQAARDAAYQEGIKAGYAQSEADLTQKMLTVLNQAHAQVQALFIAEQERIERYESEAAHLSFKAMKKVFPLLATHYEEQELKQAVIAALKPYRDAPTLQLKCAHNMSDALSGFIKENMPELSKRIDFIEDSTLSKGVCHILWAEGGVIVNRDEITQKIFAIMEETLAERGIQGHDEEDHAQDHIEESK